ncbi:MAG: HAD family hydrolase [Deltaproteobacteria bacterium]|nr:HAD family hydrolase [Deltaproteobacteria bacterium]
MRKTGVFLDRDDTIIRDRIYLDNPDDIEILPGTCEAIHTLNQKGIPVIIITNQSGIARGLLDEETLHEIHLELMSRLASMGAMIDAVYYCPHHPEGSVAEYRKTCPCRKPEPGLLYQAAKEFCLDLNSCYMIGDKPIDVETIHRVGGKGILLTHLHNGDTGQKPDFTANDLVEAVQWILEDINS